jgi:hypothetical protein
MTSSHNPVGRPPKKTRGGKQVRKVLCNMTIPANLYDFLVEHKINRSQLFVRIVEMLYVGAICPSCYGFTRQELKYGWICAECSQPPHKHIWLQWKNCEHCGDPYSLDQYGFVDQHGDCESGIDIEVIDNLEEENKEV